MDEPEYSEAFHVVMDMLKRRMENTGEDVGTAALHIMEYLNGPDDDVDDPALD